MSLFVPPTHATAATLLTACLCLLACENPPAEPDPSPSPRPQTSAAARSLNWSVPPTWNVDGKANKGSKRAKYSVPSSGDAKHNAELLVLHLGRGSKGAIEPKLQELRGEFEGAEAAGAKAETFDVGTLKVTLLELHGTYKWPLGPKIPGKGPAAQVLKKDWRALAAGVSTPHRGNWYFRMVGPNDTVQAARADFRSMLDGLK